VQIRIKRNKGYSMTKAEMLENLQKAHDLIYDVLDKLDEITDNEAQDINSYLINAMLDLDEVMGMLEEFNE